MSASAQVRIVQERKEVEVHLADGRVLSGPRGATVAQFLRTLEFPVPVVAADVDGQLRELTFPIQIDANVRPIHMADSDGALGLQAIREEGGIAIVQTESSAKHPDMPRAALAAGSVDLILSPEEMGDALKRIGSHPSLTEGDLPDMASKDHADETQVNRIFALIRSGPRNRQRRSGMNA